MRIAHKGAMMLSARKLTLLAVTVVAMTLSGCGTSGSGTITIANGPGISIICGGGGIQVRGATVTITGLKVDCTDGKKLVKVKIVLFIDRNGDGIPDETEILDDGELNTPGLSAWECGTLAGSWGSNDPPPKLFVEVELDDGTKWKETKGTGTCPIVAPTAPEIDPNGIGTEVN